MDRLPPATISIKRVKRTASEANIDEDDGPTHLQIENKLGSAGDAQKWIYVKKGFKRTNVNGPSTATPAFVFSTPPASSIPSLELHSTQVKQSVSRDANGNVITTSTHQEPQRFHLRHQPTPKNNRSFFTRISRPQETKVLFESRRPNTAPLANGGPKSQGVWNIPTNSTPAPSLSQAKLIAPSRNFRQVSGHVAVVDTHGEDFEEQMRKYTLDSIGIALQESAVERQKSSPLPPLQQTSSPRFKPKVPALRYHERHPSDEAAQPAKNVGDMSMDVDVEDDPESYVIDEFVRVPIEQLGAYFDSSQKVGLLVLEGQEDLDVFYAEEEDDDSEIYDEEEDENAENHPSADYPEDEVDSDDEFGRNPYLYRNRNASDDEEFDEDDATYSDEDVVGTTKPWNKKPSWMRTRAEIERDEEREAEEWN